MSTRTETNRLDGGSLLLVVPATVALALMLLVVRPGLTLMSGRVMFYALTLATVTLLGIFYALFGSARPRVLMATFFIFCYFWFGLSPILSFQAGSFPGGTVYTDDQLVFAYQVILVGIAAYFGSYRLASHLKGKAVVEEEEQPEESSRRTSKFHNRVPIVALGACALSLAVWLSLGGPELTFSTRRQALLRLVGEELSSATTANLKLALMRVPPALMLLVVLATRRVAHDQLRRTFLPAALIIVNLLVSSPFSTPRQWVGAVVVAALLAAFPRPRQVRATLLVVVLGVALIYPALNGFRRGFEFELGRQDLTTSLGTSLDFDAMATTVDATTAVEVTGPQGGRQLLGLMTFYVPRSVWSDKPDASGEYIFQNSPTNRYPFSNMSVTLWAEGYIDFGVPGTIVYLGAWGFVSARLEGRRRDRGRLPTRDVVLIPLIAGYQFIFLRGALLPVVATAAAIFVTYRAVVWAVGSTLPSGTPGDHGGRRLAGDGGDRPLVEPVGAPRAGW